MSSYGNTIKGCNSMEKRKGTVMLWLVAAVMALAAGATPDNKTVRDDGPVTQSQPPVLNYQGYLAGSDAQPFDGTADMAFSIYNGLSGGEPVWGPEQHDKVRVVKGFFSIQLGSLTPFASEVMGEGQRFLEISINGHTMQPRSPLTGLGQAAAVPAGAAGIHNAAARVDPHNHLGETWSSTTVTNGLTTLLNVNNQGAVYGRITTALNAGTGNTFGGYFTGGGTGLGAKYGLYCSAQAPSGSGAIAYGVHGSGSHNGSGLAYGGYFLTPRVGTGKKYGVHGSAYGLDGSNNDVVGSYGTGDHSGNGVAYGGCFKAGGTGKGIKYGSYGESISPVGSGNASYGAYGTVTHLGTGPAYGGRFYAASAGTGQKCGVIGQAFAPASSNTYAYGSYGSTEHSGSGDAFGGFFYAYGTGSGKKYGVYSIASGSGTRYAGYFAGDVAVTGTLSKGAGSFLIDHPLDPRNKTLRHNFVESPENLCLYRGKAVLGPDGSALVTMPDYFRALTKEEEATVTLTAVGKPFEMGYEWSEGFTGFTVYGMPGRAVSYIVLADRDDPVIRKLRRPVEELKGGVNYERGRLLYPDAYGFPREMGVDYEVHNKAEEIGALVPDRPLMESPGLPEGR